MRKFTEWLIQDAIPGVLCGLLVIVGVALTFWVVFWGVYYYFSALPWPL